MKNRSTLRTFVALLLVFVMAACIMQPAAVLAAEERTYILDTDLDLSPISMGEKGDGETLSVGTDGYFTICFSQKTKVDEGIKSFNDGYFGTQRLNFGDRSSFSDPIRNAVMITTSDSAIVKIWWVSGEDGREMAIRTADGTEVARTDEGSTKNSLYISELGLSEAGTYYICVPDGSNYLYKLEVTEGVVLTDPSAGRGEWNSVSDPVISSVANDGDGRLTVTVAADVSNDGGDQVTVNMYDFDGNKVDFLISTEETDSHVISFAPLATGQYSFKAILTREGKGDKESTGTQLFDFILPLATPRLTSADSEGSGIISLSWKPVAEATGYEVYCNGEKAADSTTAGCRISGLVIGETYSFQVAALRTNENGSTEVSPMSDPMDGIATEDPKTVWSFTRYGTSTNDDNNGYIGSVNTDGKVTVYSENGKGKIVPKSTDGVAFYYTAVPTEYNFTLRANVHVDSWTYSNGQDGFGLLATDRLGPNGSTESFWNNQYMAMASKVEYKADKKSYSMRLGIGCLAKTGVTPETLPKDAGTPEGFLTETLPLEQYAAETGSGGTYNVVGNYTSSVSGTIAELTDFILEIQKNNTGYFITYYDELGNIIGQVKYYDTETLSILDPDYVYVGFFAARNARMTATDIQFSSILATEDDPAEEKPLEMINPSVSLSASSGVATSEDYTVSVSSNVDGTADIYVGREKMGSIDLIGGFRGDMPIKLSQPGELVVRALFTPNGNTLEGTALASMEPVTAQHLLSYNDAYAGLSEIYVAPNGKKDADGTRENPLSIYTAVDNVCAGQTIVLLEGTYKLVDTLRIQRGINGTEDQPIRMIADPLAASRPVLDFQNSCAGIVHGGDYWYFCGFDVTASADGQKGFQVSGDHNTLDQIHAYKNGNSGIQISRYSGTDLTIDQWPSYNLILNCTSWENVDSGYEDADGFACKLTSGVGNVFDGCVAYNNADDGWDLYAKVETGEIGPVVIRNCVAYSNGILADGTLAGNGNGFKLGGESIPGDHLLINSYAFFNKSKGIDSNSCPNITIENCTSYNNGSYNVAFYTNNAANTDYAATGIVSFKDGGALDKDNLKPVGSQDTSKYLGDTNYYWDGSVSANASGVQITSDMFKSLEFNGVLRAENGILDMQGFLELNENAPIGVGAAPGGTVSVGFEPTEEAESDVASGASPALFIVIGGLVAALAAAGAVVLAKKHSSSKESEDEE